MADSAENGKPGDRAKPRFLPPVYFVAALVVMLELGYFLPLVQILTPPATYAGWLLIAAGVAIVIACWWRFEKAETTIKPYEESTALLTEGPYAYSRNPIYTAMAIALTGTGIVLGTLTPFVAIPLFVYLIRRNFILVEEAMLEEAFGDEYRAYKARVRRWL